MGNANIYNILYHTNCMSVKQSTQNNENKKTKTYIKNISVQKPAF